MADAPKAERIERGQPKTIPQGSESLEVWRTNIKPWEKMGTIIRRGGRHGSITCTPELLSCLLRRPQLLGYDEMDYLTGWCNIAVACWPKGEAPGAPPLSTNSSSDGWCRERSESWPPWRTWPVAGRLDRLGARPVAPHRHCRLRRPS